MVALVYVIAMWARDGWQSALALMIPLAIPLGLIWYAELLGDYTGRIGRAQISQKSSPFLLKGFGWLLLLAPLGALLVRWWGGSVQ